MKTIEQIQIILDINHTNTKSPDRYDTTAFQLLLTSGIVGINQDTIVSNRVCFLTPKGNAILESFKQILVSHSYEK